MPNPWCFVFTTLPLEAVQFGLMSQETEEEGDGVEP
jgi:hypothetical protein